MKTKLLIVTDSFLPRWDGVARFLAELIPSLTKHFSVEVIAPRFSGKEPRLPGVRVRTVPTFNFSLGDYSPPKPARGTVGQAVKRNHLVWVQTQGPLGNYAVKSARKQQKRLLAFVHSFEWELFSWSLSRWTLLRHLVYAFSRYYIRRNYNRCDSIIVPSDGIGETLRELGVHTPYHTVHLGTNTSKFRPPKNKGRAKEALGLDPSTTVIGYVGRVGREKDLPTMRQAYMNLKEKYPQLKLMIIGKGNPQEERSLMGEDVMLFGRIDNVVPYLKAMDIYVLPSLTETSSLSTMEAMATGLPVVTTPVGHMQHYIRDDVNGLLFSPRDREQLEHHLERLVSKPSVRKRLGREARRTIQEHYRWRDTKDRLITLLKEEATHGSEA